MNEPKLNYLGPAEGFSAARTLPQTPLFKRLPLGFLIVVALPTLVAMIYYLLIASPRYVSESRFMVRSSAQEAPSTLGAALQGVGLNTGSSNAFAVHEYITSRDSLLDVQRGMDVRQIYGRRGIDFLSRRPLPWADSSFESLYRGFQSYVTVGYESSTGMSTLRVQAFSATDARRVNDALLRGGEELVNRLNARSSQDAIIEANRTLQEAEGRLNRAQAGMTAFRNREGVIDPARSAQASGQLIGELKLSLATLNAERSQIASDTPGSPQLPILESRIRALAAQISLEEQKVVGQNDSLAPKISAYEDLVLEKEFADRLVGSATAALNSAQLDARRQHLYLVRVVNPDTPDRPMEPRRWYMILTIFASALVIYGVGWLAVASVRESRSH